MDYGSPYGAYQYYGAMASTDFATIRDDIAAELVALTPTLLNDSKKKFQDASKAYKLKPWALKNASACLRKFQLTSDGFEEPEFQHPTEYKVNESATLLVAYPVDLALYGAQGVYDMEKVIWSDMEQIRDSIFSSDNYGSAVDQRKVVNVEIDRSNENVWFLELELLLTYNRTQNL